jgi:ceramide glucosyltransferase
LVVIHLLIGVLGLVVLAVATTYAVLAMLAVLVWRSQKKDGAAVSCSPVTVLKPLCGAEPGLYENLRTFCVQNHPQFQVVFGIGDEADPALGIVERLVAEFPGLPIDVVISAQQHGHNRKISNLINMLEYARYDVLVMADSDATVGPDYLASVTAPLWDRHVGLVTCLYHGEPTRSVWSRLGAMYINEWYMPSVSLAWLFGHRNYVSGQTMCLRRETLEGIGGLFEIANHLADDYRLGQLVRNLGLRIVLSSYMLKAEHYEPTLKSLVSHELRWMHTLRVLKPGSFRFIFLTFSVPLALLGLLLDATSSCFPTIAWLLFCTTMIVRLALHVVHRVGDTRPILADLWLLPVRDVLVCWVWCRSFFTARLTWRGLDFRVDVDGVMRKFS